MKLVWTSLCATLRQRKREREKDNEKIEEKLINSQTEDRVAREGGTWKAVESCKYPRGHIHPW